MKRVGKFSWINLWMILFSVSGIWLVVRAAGMSHYAQIFPDVIVSLAILGVVLVVGLVDPFLCKTRVQEDDSNTALGDAGSIYSTAWRLFRQRWFLLIYGVVAAIIVVGVTANLVLGHHFLPYTAQSDPQSRATLHHGAMSLRQMEYMLLSSVPPMVRSTLSMFFPRIGLSSTGGILQALTAFAVLTLAIPVGKKLKILSIDQEWAQHAGLLRAAWVVLVVTALAATVIGVAVKMFADSMNSAEVRYWVFYTLYHPAELAWVRVQTLVIVPLILGGIIGSLQRTAQAGKVTTETFLKDAARVFKRMAVFFILLWAAGLVLDVPKWILMLRNIRHQQGGLSVREGIMRSLRIWKDHTWMSVSFIALGVTIMTVFEAVKVVTYPLVKTQWGNVSVAQHTMD